MLRLLSFVLLSFVGPLAVDHSRAQPADSLATDVESSRVIVPVAVGLEYLFPTLGHAYAGDWVRGVPPFAVSLAGVTVAAVAIIECQCLFDAPSPATGIAITAGLLTAVAGRIWGLYSAYRTAEDHNEAIPSRFSFGPARETLGLRIALDL